MTDKNSVPSEHFYELQAKAKEPFAKFEELRGFL
jgi:hypothetical protein